jgi:hypothetical protein
MIAVGKQYVNELRLGTNNRVKSHIGIIRNTAVEGELFTFHIKRTDRRVMRNLFQVDRNATKIALKSFA